MIGRDWEKSVPKGDLLHKCRLVILSKLKSKTLLKLLCSALLIVGFDRRTTFLCLDDENAHLSKQNLELLYRHE